MTDKALFNISDFKDYKDISEHMDVDRMRAIILETQVVELRSLLGKELYFALVSAYNEEDNDFDVITTPTNIRYQNLWFGVDSATERFYGLLPMMVQLSYARIIQDVNINITRSGVRVFDDEESEAAVQAAINTKATAAKSIALIYRQDVIDYLQKDLITYPEFSDSDSYPKQERATGFNFFKV